MERIRRDRRFAIFADDIHFGDIPSLACWYDEIVSSEAVIIIKGGFEILRSNATRCRCRIIVLIVEDDRRCMWK
jgi:hypothetical protein